MAAIIGVKKMTLSLSRYEENRIVLQSRVRFSMRTLLALPIVAGLSIFLLDLALPRAIKDGRVTIPLDFLVLDAQTRMPIDGAEILLYRDLPVDPE